MIPFVLIFDDVLDNPDWVRTEALAHDFDTVTSPVDRVEYPLIQKACPGLDNSMWLALRRVFPRNVIDMKFCFARMMPEGQVQPHRIHQDLTMADYSAHIYLNPQTFPGTGTQFWSHEVMGQRYSPETYDDRYGLHENLAWTKTMFVPARFNRLLIHDSSLWHSAEPNYGFGASKEDARLVLTTFFNLRER